MESELDVGFAELHLFVTQGRAMMQKTGRRFLGPCSVFSREFHLIDECAIGVCKEPVRPWREVVARCALPRPQQLAKIRENRSLWQLDRAHGRSDVQARESV